MGNDGPNQRVYGSSEISIHVPAWGTTRKVDVICQIKKISIHVPAWGTTDHMLLAYADYLISIHVPAWGTTIQDAYMEYKSGISIHVPAWGTTGIGRKRGGRKNFNPRSRVGNDRSPYAKANKVVYFNPRSRVGNDCTEM